MQPGMTRAVPMGFIGFMLGAAFVLVLRGLQSMDPLWDAQIGIVFAGLIGSIFFLWGIGAFNGKLAYHHMDAHYDDEQGIIVVETGHDDHDEHEVEEVPGGIVTGQVSQVALWTLLLFATILLFAAWQPGPSLTISTDAAANTNTIGYFTMEIGSTEVVVSQLTALILFVLIALASLAVIGGVIGLVFFNLSRGIVEVKAAGNVPLNALPAASVAGLLPSGEAEPAAPVRAIRSASNRARAFIVPNMIFFALIYPNVVLGLATFGIGGDGVAQLTLGALISLVLTLLLLNAFPTPAARRAELAPVRVLLVGGLVLASTTLVFAAILNLVTQASTWLFIPVEPVLATLPLLSGIFITPFIMDVIFNGGRTPAEAARFVIVRALLFEVLYPVFYGAAIGLVLPSEPLRTLLTAVNAAVIVMLLLHTGEFLWVIGKFAAGIVWALRRVPYFIGQR